MPAELVPISELRPLPGVPVPDRSSIESLVASIRAHGLIVPLLVRPASCTHVVQEGRRGWQSGYFVIEPRLVCDRRYLGQAPFFASRTAAEESLPADVPYEVVKGIRRFHAARTARLRRVPCLVAAISDAEVAALRAAPAGGYVSISQSSLSE